MNQESLQNKNVNNVFVQLVQEDFINILKSIISKQNKRISNDFVRNTINLMEC